MGDFTQPQQKFVAAGEIGDFVIAVNIYSVQRPFLYFCAYHLCLKALRFLIFQNQKNILKNRVRPYFFNFERIVVCTQIKNLSAYKHII